MIRYFTLILVFFASTGLAAFPKVQLKALIELKRSTTQEYCILTDNLSKIPILSLREKFDRFLNCPALANDVAFAIPALKEKVIAFGKKTHFISQNRSTYEAAVAAPYAIAFWESKQKRYEDFFKISHAPFTTFNSYQKFITCNTCCTKTKGSSPISFSLHPRDPALKISSDKRTLLVQGLIKKGFAINLQATLWLHPEIERIALKSEGGDLQETLNAGQVIHCLNLDTLIIGPCFSACPLLFLAGNKRAINQPYPPVGVHRLYYLHDNKKFPLSPFTSYQALIQYLDTVLGPHRVQASYLFEAMLKADRQTIFLLPIKDLITLCIVNTIDGQFLPHCHQDEETH